LSMIWIDFIESPQSGHFLSSVFTGCTPQREPRSGCYPILYGTGAAWAICTFKVLCAGPGGGSGWASRGKKTGLRIVCCGRNGFWQLEEFLKRRPGHFDHQAKAGTQGL
jgi:hypothetical protein